MCGSYDIPWAITSAPADYTITVFIIAGQSDKGKQK
jgi:hypothetical protein